jgi:hypothetical protein
VWTLENDYSFLKNQGGFECAAYVVCVHVCSLDEYTDVWAHTLRSFMVELVWQNWQGIESKALNFCSGPSMRKLCGLGQTMYPLGFSERIIVRFKDGFRVFHCAVSCIFCEEEQSSF